MQADDVAKWEKWHSDTYVYMERCTYKYASSTYKASTNPPKKYDCPKKWVLKTSQAKVTTTNEKIKKKYESDHKKYESLKKKIAAEKAAEDACNKKTGRKWVNGTCTYLPKKETSKTPSPEPAKKNNPTCTSGKVYSTSQKKCVKIGDSCRTSTFQLKPNGIWNSKGQCEKESNATSQKKAACSNRGGIWQNNSCKGVSCAPGYVLKATDYRQCVKVGANCNGSWTGWTKQGICVPVAH
jgi:hypothetical protein